MATQIEIPVCPVADGRQTGYFLWYSRCKVMLLAIFLHEKNSNDYSTQTQENYILENMGFHDTMVISMYSFHCRDYRQKNK